MTASPRPQNSKEYRTELTIHISTRPFRVTSQLHICLFAHKICKSILVHCSYVRFAPLYKFTQNMIPFPLKAVWQHLFCFHANIVTWDERPWMRRELHPFTCLLTKCRDYSGYGLSRQGETIPDSKVHGPNMGPIWGRQDPSGPHDGPMNFAIRDIVTS